ncbi:MAG: PQQ-dependent sugar dehydrogenase, partial [Ignavibacteriae bacterium]|nr:PQQ-dependent sugar dehydrogenase [Ignavibacteriota bacterium]
MLKFIYTFSLFVLLSVFILSCKSDETLAQVNIERAFPNLSFQNPVDIQTPNDGTNRLFVVSQLGKIFVFDNNNDIQSAKTFLDITDRVLFGGEQGLLGLAFHPNYNSNGVFFLNYTTSNPRRTLISKFTVSNNPDSAIKNSEEILLEVE